MGFSTDAIHAGQEPERATGALITPIFMTTTYAQEELGINKGYEYGRRDNLTRAALEKNIAVLENGKYGIAFSSGLAAISAVIHLVKAGEHVIVTDNVYGGTYRLFEKIMTGFNLQFSWVDVSSLENVSSAIKENTRMVYIETPSNPTLNITDIRSTAELCKKNNLICAVDNTFMSPYFQKPLNMNADIVVHSSTKYLNGHSDVIGGIVITNDKDTNKKLKFIQNAVGAVPSPFDCWLTLRSTKTLALRMKQHNENAVQIADFLKNQNYVKHVYYPGLKSHPGYELAKKQMTGFGGIISVDFGEEETARRFIKKCKIFTLAESLGGVESLMSHPATMSHASVPPERREKMGITNSLIRLSVGIEDIEDLLGDIDQAVQ